MTSSTDRVLPMIVSASFGQAATQSPESVHLERSTWCLPSTMEWTPEPQASAQRPQFMHLSGLNESCGRCSMASGLWHHLQLKGHPLRNTVVRIPGPSCREKRWISTITADLILVRFGD